MQHLMDRRWLGGLRGEHRRILWTFVGLLGLWVGASGALAGDQDAYVERGTPPPMARLLEWHDAAGVLQARALVVSAWTETTELNRVLVQVSGVRLLLDEVSEPLEGRTSRRIAADDSEWWIETTDMTNFKLERMADVGRPASTAEQFMDENRTLQITVRDSNSLSYRTPVQDWFVGARSDLLASLEAAGLGSRLVESMSSDIRGAVRRLDALRSATPRDGAMERFDSLIELIDGLLDAHEEPPKLRQAREVEANASEWTLSSPAFELGIALDSERLRDFAARFESVDPSAPLPQLKADKAERSE